MKRSHKATTTQGRVKPTDISNETPDPKTEQQLRREIQAAATSIENPEVRQTILSVLRAGGTITDAAKYAGIAPSKLRGWYARGKGLVEGKRPTHRYRLFASEIDKARASVKVLALGTLTAAIQSRHFVKTGEQRTFDEEGRVVRVDFIGREEIAPLAKDAALAMLGAIDPKKWGNGHQRIELTGADGGPIEVNEPTEVSNVKAKILAMSGAIAAAAMRMHEGRLPHPLGADYLLAVPVLVEAEGEPA